MSTPEEFIEFNKLRTLYNKVRAPAHPEARQKKIDRAGPIPVPHFPRIREDYHAMGKLVNMNGYEIKAILDTVPLDSENPLVVEAFRKFIMVVKLSADHRYIKEGMEDYQYAVTDYDRRKSIYERRLKEIDEAEQITKNLANERWVNLVSWWDNTTTHLIQRNKKVSGKFSNLSLFHKNLILGFKEITGKQFIKIENGIVTINEITLKNWKPDYETMTRIVRFAQKMPCSS